MESNFLFIFNCLPLFPLCFLLPSCWNHCWHQSNVQPPSPEGRRIEKKELERRLRRSMRIEKAKATFNFIHWCGMQMVIAFLKFQYTVKCWISLIMLHGH